MRHIVVLLIMICGHVIAAQEPYTCANKGYDYFRHLSGHWSVATKDRTSPGEYQNNTGKAIISPGIDGCGISLSYRGIYKDKAYAREVSLIALDSVNFQMVAMDSEHGSYSFLEGRKEEKQLILYWFRNKEVGKLRSKYIMTHISADQFEFSSFLSTDHGESWALTHERKYRRIE